MSKYEPIIQPPIEPLNSHGSDNDNQPPKLIPIAKWYAIAGLCLANVGVSTDSSVITVGLPQISSDMGLMKYFGWSSGAFLLTACVAQPICGRFCVSGRRRAPLIAGILLYHSGTTVCGLVNTAAPFLVGRALSGIGAALLYVGGQAVVVSLFPAKDVAFWLSTFSFVSMLFGITFPVLCGIIICQPIHILLYEHCNKCSPVDALLVVQW